MFFPKFIQKINHRYQKIFSCNEFLKFSFVLTYSEMFSWFFLSYFTKSCHRQNKSAKYPLNSGYFALSVIIPTLLPKTSHNSQNSHFKGYFNPYFLSILIILMVLKVFDIILTSLNYFPTGFKSG